MNFDSQYSKTHERRFRKTLHFLEEVVPPPKKILDIGPVNPFTAMLEQAGYAVTNTAEGVDLDYQQHEVARDGFDVVTAFEIFEHMVNPFSLLRLVRAPYLVASVPLKLWFASAYWNEKDPFDRHYHEFEARQFDMLLNKAGWQVQKQEKWITPSSKIGLRPLLRNFTPRHYIVFAVKAS